MSVFAQHMITRHSVTPVPLTAEQYARTVYPGQLVWYVPGVTGGKVAARLISIDLDRGDVELEVTATKSRYYRRGERVFHVPYTHVFGRNVTRHHWATPRFSLQWLDYPTAKERAGEEWQRLSVLVAAQ